MVKIPQVQTGQRAALAVSLLPHLEKEANERMTAGINQYSSPVQLFEQGKKGKATKKAAEIANVNHHHHSALT